MQHESTAPFRFRSPAGWPTPSPEWVELHQAAEPAPGWTPAPGIPAAPAEWRFWVPAPRAFRAYLPPLARRLRVLQWVGLAVALASLAAVLIVAALGGPAVLALAPLVAGVAVLVVSSSRYGDLAARTALSVRDDAAAWRRSELPARARAARPDLDDASAVAAWEAAAWGLPTANPFARGSAHRTPCAEHAAVVPSVEPRSARCHRAGVAACVLVIGASAAVPRGPHRAGAGIPDPGARTPGRRPDEAAPDADEADPNPWTSDDGTITVSFLSDEDTWQATCGCDRLRRRLLGVADRRRVRRSRRRHHRVLRHRGRHGLPHRHPHGAADVRDAAGAHRAGPEEWSSIVDVRCSAPPKSPVALTKTELDSDHQDEDGSWPDGCVDWAAPAGSSHTAGGLPVGDGPVLDRRGDRRAPGPARRRGGHTAHAGEPVDVWAGGAWSSDHDATLAPVHCG